MGEAFTACFNSGPPIPHRLHYHHRFFFVKYTFSSRSLKLHLGYLILPIELMFFNQMVCCWMLMLLANLLEVVWVFNIVTIRPDGNFVENCVLLGIALNSNIKELKENRVCQSKFSHYLLFISVIVVIIDIIDVIIVIAIIVLRRCSQWCFWASTWLVSFSNVSTTG